jgi:histone H2A
MRAKNPNLRLSKTAAVFATAVLEYLCADLLHYSAEETLLSKKKRITPKHITQAIRNDRELKLFLNHIEIFDPKQGVFNSITAINQPFTGKYKTYLNKRRK